MSENKQLGIFLAIAYGIAWISEAAMILLYRINVLPEGGGVIHFIILALFCGMAPTYAAFIAKRFSGCKIRDLLIKDGMWKNKLMTAIAFVLLAIVFYFLNAILEQRNSTYPWYLTPVMFIVMIFGGGLEEIGWRSIMQPVLFKKMPFFIAVLVQSLMWALWHFPLWFVQNTSQIQMSFLFFTIYCIVACLALSVLYEATKSVIACVFLHAWCNTCQGIFSFNYLCPNPDGSLWPPVKVLIVYGFCVASFVIMYFITRGINKSRNSDINIEAK